MAQTKKAKLSDVRQDPGNANRHTERGREMLNHSISRFGSREPGVLDKNGFIVGGNHRREKYEAAQMNEIVIVPASSDVPVFVQYDDLDLTDPDNPARAVAHALNRVAQVSVEVDPERVLTDIQAGLDLDAFYSPDELAELEEELLLASQLSEAMLTDAGVTAARRDIGANKQKQVKPVVYVDELKTFEAAIKATGEKNRGKAVIAICEAFLDTKGQFDF